MKNFNSQLIGKKFNRLTILDQISYINSNGERRRKWMCICDCGTITDVRNDHLVKNQTTSCGCFCKEQNLLKKGKPSKFRLPPGEAMFNNLIANYKRRARHKKLDWTLSNDEFKLLTTQNCHYCGNPPNCIKKRKHANITNTYVYNGIDRKDSNIGYIKENCVPCCYGCNVAKMDSSYEEFLNKIIQIYNYMNLKDK